MIAALTANLTTVAKFELTHNTAKFSMSKIDPNRLSGPDSPHFNGEEPLNVLPWEEVANGRFMPRRVRGSNKGRALG